MSSKCPAIFLGFEHVQALCIFSKTAAAPPSIPASGRHASGNLSNLVNIAKVAAMVRIYGCIAAIVSNDWLVCRQTFKLMV